jgi:hypothetical protein
MCQSSRRGRKREMCKPRKCRGRASKHDVLFKGYSSHDFIAPNLQPPSPKSKSDKNESQSGGDSHQSNQGHQMSTEDVAYSDITFTAICSRVRSAEGDPVIDRTG